MGTFCPVLPGSTPPCYWSGLQFSVGCVSLIFFIVFVVIGVDEAVAVVDTNEAVDVVTIVLIVFCGQDLDKWPICLQCKHCSFRPSTTTIMA